VLVSLKKRSAVMGIWFASERWMKPDWESRELSGSVYGIGEGGGASTILYTNVGNGLFAIMSSGIRTI
jgi:hypothetical protein